MKILDKKDFNTYFAENRPKSPEHKKIEEEIATHSSLDANIARKGKAVVLEGGKDFNRSLLDMVEYLKRKPIKNLRDYEVGIAKIKIIKTNPTKPTSGEIGVQVFVYDIDTPEGRNIVLNEEYNKTRDNDFSLSLVTARRAITLLHYYSNLIENLDRKCSIDKFIKEFQNIYNEKKNKLDNIHNCNICSKNVATKFMSKGEDIRVSICDSCVENYDNEKEEYIITDYINRGVFR